MSTRGCVARLTSKEGAKRIKFSGIYLQWDNYPSSTGSTLFQARNGHFKGDTNAMLNYLIDQHPQGFSTINGCDFSLPSAPRIDNKLEICKVCGLPNWRHYSQYYNESNEEWVKAGKPECPFHNEYQYLVADHSPVPEDKPHGAECYLKSEEKSNDPITEKNASGCGCEYVYAFTKDGNTMLVLSSYCSKDEEVKMIGMWGCGDKKAKWKIIGKIDLNGMEPNDEEWQKVPIVQGERMEVETMQEGDMELLG